MSLSPENVVMLERAAVRSRVLLERDPELAQSTPSLPLFERVIDRRTSIEIVQRACEVYADRPALGSCGTLETLSYRALWQRVVRVASGLGAPAGTMAILIGFSTIDHVVAELACHYLAAVSIPLAKDISARELEAIAAQTACRVMFCSVGQLAVAIEARCPTVETLVVIDARSEDDPMIERARAALPNVTTIAELEARDAFVPPVIPEADPLLSLVYTSGSTGSPKGAMFCERSWRARWSTLPTLALAALPMVSVVFLPQNHMGGRNAVANSIKVGGLAYFTAQSDMSTLFDDIRRVRPTYIHLVPRLSEMIYQHFEREVARRGDADAVIAEMRARFLGDRMVLALTASAPTPAHILDFVRRTFEIPVINIFAGTEYGHLFTDGRLNGQNVLAHKLVDVPELGYTTADTPHPRGELLVKTARGITSYFQNEQATKNLLDPDGFLRTGDIFEQRGDDFVWIDRRNNVVKLAQGEFVNLWKLEAAFATSPLIRQVYLHGDSARAYLVGVVVPAPDVPEAQLFAEVQRIASEQRLAAYEIPRDLVIAQPFTRENGLLTSLGKPARPKLLAKYKPALDACYARLDARPAVSTDLPLAARVEATIAARFGRIDLTRSFKSHGGDSLAATELCAAIESCGGARVSPGFVLGPQTTLADIIAAASARDERPTFERIHGAHATAVRANDLRLDRFFEPAHVPPSETTGNTLLTGATGFLGRFLCLELLTRGGRVTCVVRAKSDDEALQRLAHAYGPGTPLHARFLALASRLRVVAGDLEHPELGWSRARYDELAGEIDTVVHAGALVNHALDYRALFDANVSGTANVIRFALAQRRKRLGYISTNAVSLALLGDRDLARETDDTRALGDGWRIDANQYANGYQLSKWAGEVLARDFAERYGGDVAIFRCNLILPPERTRNQVPADDFLTRLVASVIETGVYPRSFYAADGAIPQLDGLPADFIAAAIVSILPQDFAVYHLSNMHWTDGISLDTVMKRLVALGYPLAQIDDHTAWFQRFERALVERAGVRASSLPIIERWRRPLQTARRRAIDASRFRTEVRARLGLDDLPCLDEDYLDRCIRDMQSLGLIAGPRA